MPAFLVRLMMGEMGEEFLLSSRRMHPSILLAAGTNLNFQSLNRHLRHEIVINKTSLVLKVDRLADEGGCS